MEFLRKLNPSLRVLLATVWVGTIWGVGYVAAPVLFSTLADRSLAGTLAGKMFEAGAVISMTCGFALSSMLITARDQDAAQRRTCLGLVGVMLAITLVAYFGLQPMMAELRAAAGSGGVMGGEGAGRFGMLHGISSSLHLLQSLLGIWLVLRIR